MLKTEIGKKAEELACKYLISNGLNIIDMNFKALPYGEIDIIALENKTIVFIEVKYRKNHSFGYAEEMVNIKKQEKIINTAQMFLLQFEKYQNYECRFDVVAINKNDISWYKSAFES